MASRTITYSHVPSLAPFRAIKRVVFITAAALPLCGTWSSITYRSWAIPCTGKQVYARRHRAEWLGKITEPGVRRRAEFYYQQLDALRTVLQEVRRELLAEAKKHQAWNSSARFLRSVRFGQPYYLAFCRPRTVSAPSGSYGVTADLASRPTAAPITVVWTGS